MQAESTSPPEWREVAGEMKVVTLSLPLRIAVPLLGVPSLSARARGMTLLPGPAGGVVGALLLASAAFVAYLAYPAAGPLGAFLSLWLLGSAGGATLAAAVRPTAFVKPICVRCRLLPVIKEHEAIHLTGVSSERAVWESMKTRHSVDSLGLRGDPAICHFCPIPKRLAES